MSSFWWNFHHWLHRKLSKWQLSVPPVTKISSKWRHFRFSDIMMLVMGSPGIINQPVIHCGIQFLVEKCPALQWRHNECKCVSNHLRLDCLLNRSCISKETSKLRVTGLCEGNPPVTDDFPTQRASNTANVFIWWRHHGLLCCLCLTWVHPKIPAWISNYINCNVCEEITSPFPNFNGAAVEVWEWINNVVLYFAGYVIAYYMLGSKLIHVNKRGPCEMWQ